VLYSHYFLAADLMRNNYVKLKNKWRNHGYLSQDDTVAQGIYFSSWLGFLGVTCEGYKKLKMRILLQGNRPEAFRELIPKSDEIGRVMKQHSDPLRGFRNNVFHLRDDIEAMQRFFANGAVRLVWAEGLHAAIAEFFSMYRVLCEVHYVMHGRASEMQMGQNRPRLRKMSAS
jgi:hypothetical protein|tara:strand:+ start:1756 stop:2271 length:516 start_codon:yes stop_codon:yes gene_type:complete